MHPLSTSRRNITVVDAEPGKMRKRTCMQLIDSNTNLLKFHFKHMHAHSIYVMIEVLIEVYQRHNHIIMQQCSQIERTIGQWGLNLKICINISTNVLATKTNVRQKTCMLKLSAAIAGTPARDQNNASQIKKVHVNEQILRPENYTDMSLGLQSTGRANVVHHQENGLKREREKEIERSREMHGLVLLTVIQCRLC